MANRYGDTYRNGSQNAAGTTNVRDMRDDQHAVSEGYVVALADQPPDLLIRTCRRD